MTGGGGDGFVTAVRAFFISHSSQHLFKKYFFPPTFSYLPFRSSVDPETGSLTVNNTDPENPDMNRETVLDLVVLSIQTF